MASIQEFEKVLDKSDTTVASFEERSLLRRIQHFLHSTPAAVPAIVLILSIVVFGVLKGERFFTAGTLTLILQQIAVVGILGAGQTLVILTAGIDLSIGVIMVLSAVVMGNCAVTYGMPAPIAVAIGFAVAGLCGLVNGFLVARVKLPPFIVTLGTWSIFAAINYIYSANETIRRADIETSAPLLGLFGYSIKIGSAVFTLGVIMMVGIVVSNSILLVEFIRRLREEGMPLEDAVPMAGRVRLRPILMTSLATIIGLLPMALKLGTGSEAYAPLARSIIGGMTVSLILTVFLVPSAYKAVYGRKRS